jgi:hypothetical protein
LATRIPIEGPSPSSLIQSTEGPSAAPIPIEASKESTKESSSVFYPDEGINENIVKKIYRFNTPSEIIKNQNLYGENHARVVTTLRSLGAQKRGKYANPEIDD